MFTIIFYACQISQPTHNYDPKGRMGDDFTWEYRIINLKSYPQPQTKSQDTNLKAAYNLRRIFSVTGSWPVLSEVATQEQETNHLTVNDMISLKTWNLPGQTEIKYNWPICKQLPTSSILRSQAINVRTVGLPLSQGWSQCMWTGFYLEMGYLVERW